jgi:GNAT superfamily N-acetyltransferase
MKKVQKHEMPEIAHLFSGIEDSMVTACIQGYMGNAYVDKLPNPKAGLIISGEYSFFAGDAKCKEAALLAEKLFDLNPSAETVCIFPGDEPEWETELMKVKQYSPKALFRYRIAQKNHAFDEKLLSNYAAKIPTGYTLVTFNEKLYNQAISEDWSKEFCETFNSSEDYLARGFGFAVVYNDRLVAGASTMTVYDGGAEIQVATHPKYRKKGLAMVCAATLILECQRRGMKACWDAANKISKKMAIALGYEYIGEYTTIIMHSNKKTKT